MVTLNGSKLPIMAAFPFQINAQLPADAATGTSELQVAGALGTSSKTISIVPVAPGIFVIGTSGAVVNQDGSLNSPDSPAQRGQFVSIYCSGLGTTALKGGLQVTAATVTVILNGNPVAPSFAGLTPGFIGLYQVNATVPAGAPPLIKGSLALRESGETSNVVLFSLQ